MLRITISPPAELERRIEALRHQVDNVDQNISAVVRETAIAVRETAIFFVPVSTGSLRRSLKVILVNNGMAALIGSWLPYASRQEFDENLNHEPRPGRIRVRNTVSGKSGSVIKGTQQINPNASFGFLRAGLGEQEAPFLAKLQALADGFGDAWMGK